MQSNISLTMHWLVCPGCKNYYQQAKIITRNSKYFSSKGMNNSPLYRLLPAEKSKLEKVISNKIILKKKIFVRREVYLCYIVYI